MPFWQFFTTTYIKVAGISGLEKLDTWSGNIVNHFWHSSKSCGNNAIVLKVKWKTKVYSCVQERWLSMLHHVTNEYQWITQQCDHAAEISPPRDVLQYFNKREPAFKALQN